MAWTDERLDDRLRRIDERFDRVDARFERIDERFDRMDARFDRVDERFERMDARFDDVRRELKADIESLRALTLRFGVTMIGGLLGVIAGLVGVAVGGVVPGG